MLDALVRAGASAPAIHAAQLAGAVESLQGALAIFDSDDRLVLCNGRFRGLLGEIPATRLAGRAYADILDDWLEALVFGSPRERDVYRRDRLAERGAPDGTSDARTLDGRSLRMTTRRTADGGMVLTVWDLSEDVRREEELRTARAAADTANTAKSEFLASMSHELRTPLSAVLGFAQLLQRDVREPLSPRHRARVDQIMRGGEHLLRLINDILDLSGIEAGRTSISVEPVHLAEVLEELRVTLLPMATHHGISLAVDILPAEIPAVLVDRTRFAQVLMNFGSNAIKYNRAGGAVVLSVERRPDGRVRVSVIDSGVGIPLGEQDKLFQPFHRAGQETGSIEGTGIGLAISRRLAALMHASVGFTSKPDIGSTFWIDVVAEGERGAVAEVPSIDALVTLHVVAPQVVLHVEDNPANIAFMTDLLGGFPSIELVTATTAELGIGLAVTRRPATILMDINLPGMSGLEALHALRSSPVTAGIPVIALTAAASDRDRERGLAAGFFRYLTKPVRVDELLLALDAVLAPGLAEPTG